MSGCDDVPQEFTQERFRIRPAARHILTIGRDLIQDPFAAVVELVKNAYDADSTAVDIQFVRDSVDDRCTISISDNGHGMSREDVITQWMVPSTKNKLERRNSPAGRLLQGRKGIGRFAASILGQYLVMSTVNAQGEMTVIEIDWAQFEQAEYLEDVELSITSMSTRERAGTKLIISGDSDVGWQKEQIDLLRYELKKLIPPNNQQNDVTISKDLFAINLQIIGVDGVDDTLETIESYPILELFDYRIEGSLDAQGKGTLYYSTQKIRPSAVESIDIDYSKHILRPCGQLHFDIRVFDRESAAIGTMINRGLTDKDGNYLGKLAARQLLNMNNGVGVYRNGFRIRPLGDAQYDWLRLNQKRVQTPARKIGSNQVIGFVHIESEEHSELTEKSARDGLRDNASFESLKFITGSVIEELEKRRYLIRRTLNLASPKTKIERDIMQLFSVEKVTKVITGTLNRHGVSDEVKTEIITALNEDSEDRNKVVENIRQTVAIYQGQATLGKIINVVLHEGRRPLNYFKNQVQNLHFWHTQYEKEPTSRNLTKLLPIADGLGLNARIFSTLFSRLDPLAAGKRTRKGRVDLESVCSGVFAVFENAISAQDVEVSVIGPADFQYSGWSQDFYAIFTNLVDNSLYWMREGNVAKQSIRISFECDSDKLVFVDYRDTGPGIETALIESGVIFEPDFSTKHNGTGLGLAIAGEAALRNALELTVLESCTGAYFRLQPTIVDVQ